MAQQSRQYKNPTAALTRGRDKGTPARIAPQGKAQSKPQKSNKK